ncbi:unnamed protein product [marine sediment metagenome]|uniref:Uncharacterized protein n=1 Tax=marine sediment metagenome TaxID=412755 RepID=X1RVE8_9ZZZZ
MLSILSIDKSKKTLCQEANKMNKEKMVISMRELKDAIKHIEKTRTNITEATTGLFYYDNFLRVWKDEEDHNEEQLAYEKAQAEEGESKFIKEAEEQEAYLDSQEGDYE